MWYFFNFLIDYSSILNSASIAVEAMHNMKHMGILLSEFHAEQKRWQGNLRGRVLSAFIAMLVLSMACFCEHMDYQMPNAVGLILL